MAAESQASSADPKSILISVKSQEDGEELRYFKQKITTPFAKLFTEYRKLKGRPRNYYIYLYDGCKLEETETPVDVGMDVDDEKLGPDVVCVDALHLNLGGADEEEDEDV